MFTEKFLGQLRPDNSSVKTLYTNPENTRTIIKQIQIANAINIDGKVKIYLDNTGTNLSGTLQIFTVIPSFNSKSFSVFWVIDGGGSLMIQVVDSVGGTTVTAYGAEVT